MNISAWAIRNPIPIFLTFLILCLLGWNSFKSLGINQWPDVDFPIIVVTVTQPGAAATELETDVTRKVEDTLVGIKDLDHIRSTVVEGASTTIVEFKVGANTETALNDVRDAVSRIRQNLPADVNEPIISHPNGSGEPIITYTIASEKRSVGELSDLVDEEITRSLLTVPGVASVTRDGGLTREIRVRLNPARLQGMGTSVDFVNSQLRQLNLNLPGGKSELAGGDIGIRTMGAVRSVAELKALPIPLANGTSVRLDALGEVSDDYTDVTQIARVDGQPVVGFSVVRSQGAPLVQTEEGVRKQMAVLDQTMPDDITFKLIRTEATFTNAAYHASIDALILGAALAVVVIYLFLRNWQSTVISGLAIPLSIIPTFWVMHTFGYSLNGMTTLALTLVVGILVDDAIVDLENIHRHIDMGKSPWRAAFEATAEIGLAVVATTLTIVVVFLPVSFMGGIPGMFFRSFGISVAVSVLFSLVVARTLTPLLAAYMLPAHKGAIEHKEPFYRAFYMKALRWSLKHRWLVVAGAVVIFFASLTLVPMLPKGFISNGDTGAVTVNVSLPSGVAVEETDRVVQAATAVLKQHDEVLSVYSTAGSGGSSSMAAMQGSASGVATGKLYVSLKPRHERATTLDAFVEKVAPELRRIPGARISVVKAGAAGPGGKPVMVILRGGEGDVLEKTAEKVLAEMRAMPGLVDVTSTSAEMRPEVQIKPDPARAAEQGVLVAAIGRAARVATQGDSDINLPKFNAGDEQINIRVQLTEDVKYDMAAIGNLMLPARGGNMVPLRSVADVTLGSGPVQISRYDRARQVTLDANLGAGATLGTAMEKIAQLPSMRALPPGVEQGSLGQAKIMADIFAGFGRALGMGVILIYAVLVLLFRGFLQPLTIMGALPLAIGGAFLGLLLGGKELGMMGLIGVIMLMGLVTKNSILLVEYALQARARGLGRHEAILLAGHDRLRPIIMTTIAMIAGMLPIALSLGEGTERLSPMAAAVVGGLITSTALTLIVIPVAYTLVDDVAEFFRRRLNWLWKRNTEDENAPEEAAREAGPVGSAHL